MNETSYLPSDPGPAPDLRDAWLLRIKRAIVATVAAALVVLFIMAMSGTADSLHREPSPADVAARAGLCSGQVARAYRLEGGPVHVECFARGQ